MTTEPQAVPDPLPVCGYAYTGGTGIRWVCRAAQHPNTRPDHPHGGGHYFVAHQPAR